MSFQFEDCFLDVRRRELRRNGELCHTEPQVFDLLHYLIANRDRVVSRDDICAAIWRGRVVSESVLSTRINAARTAIGDDGTRQRLIRTLRRHGLRFVGAVREGDGRADALPALQAKQRLTLGVAGAPTLAVLPFGCSGNNAERDPFAFGLTEEIVDALCQVDWLLVVSNRTLLDRAVSAAIFKEVAQRVGARYLLYGSVNKESENARIVVRLVDGTSGIYLWAEHYQSDIGDAFPVQANLAAQVTLAVSDQIFGAERIRIRQKSRKGDGPWEAIVAALSLINTRRKRDAGAAAALLRRVVAADRKTAAALGLLSFVRTLGVHQGWQSQKTLGPTALGGAIAAIGLDDEDSWGHVAAGYAMLQIKNRPEQAIEALGLALNRNPNLSIAHYLIALAAAYLGDTDSAFKHADLADRLRPRDLLARGNAGAHDNVRATACFVAGRYQEGIVFARKAIAQSPRQASAYRQLLVNSALAGQADQATRALEMVRRLSPNLDGFLKDSARSWGRRADYAKYREAFRAAGYG